MAYFVIAIIALIAGAILGYFASEPQRRILNEQKQFQDDRDLQHAELVKDFHEKARRFKEETLVLQEAERNKEAAVRDKLAREAKENNQTARRLEAQSAELRMAQKELDSRVISYEELMTENSILKSDLRNIDTFTRKMAIDRETQRESQEVLDVRISELGRRYLKENVKWIGTALSPNNFAASKQKLIDVIGRSRDIGLLISIEEENELVSNLKSDYEKVVRAAFEREEQSRIRAQIREEQLRQREIDRELKQLDREREAIQSALSRALALSDDQHSEEIERLKARLAAAEGKQRAISQAQLTKSGHVYVISNIGSFGENMLKVGMTRRLDPMDRVLELGDASVPFPFDVHMMIASDDAPALENALHRQLHKLRVNKANPRKEYFKIDIETVKQMVTELHGEVEYIADPSALEYRQSLTMSGADEEFIESVYNDIEEEEAIEDEDV